MVDQEERLLMLIDDEPAQSRLVTALAAREGWRTVVANDALFAGVLAARHEQLVDGVRKVERSLGDGVKKFLKSEISVSNKLRAHIKGYVKK